MNRCPICGCVVVNGHACSTVPPDPTPPPSKTPTEPALAKVSDDPLQLLGPKRRPWGTRKGYA